MRWHWNKRDGKRTEGYAVAHLGERRSVRVEWNLWSHFCGTEVEATYEGAWKLMLALPPVALWITYSGPFRAREEREVSFRIHDGAIWWRFWRDPNSWSRDVPRWRDGSWRPIDTLLGRSAYSKVDLATHAILIPMPEGCYSARATFERCTWKRPRWFARVRDFTKVDIGARGGIPHEGKGENSWDCGIDGLCGYSTEGHDLDAAIGDGVARSLRYRQRRDGSRWSKYPAPSKAEVSEPTRSSRPGEGAASTPKEPTT